MIAWLSGEVMARDPKSGLVVLNVQGVGYELQISLQCLRGVPEPGEKCELWVHTHVREDILALFGFQSLQERSLFRMLTSVPKVGPKHAMATLGGFETSELIQCIASGEAEKLQRVPGIGKRTAEQIVLTLRDRVAAAFPVASPAANDSDSVPMQDTSSGARTDAENMLIALGWKAKPVEKVLDRVLSDEDCDDFSLDELVRRALAKLMETSTGRPN